MIKRKMTKFICKYCKKEFELPSSETRVKEGKVKYCSVFCRNKGAKTGIIKKCKR